MGLMQTLARFLAADPRQQRAMMEQRASAGSAIIPWHAGKPQWLPREIATYDTEAYRKIALIFRCAQYVADAAATAPLRAYQDIAGEAEEVEDHPLRNLFVRPNPQMGEARFMSFITMVMSVSGFVLIEKERDRFGSVIALWPLRSDWARPIPRQQSAPDWEYRIPGEQSARILKADDVIPITYADTPDGSYTGIGPLETVLRETSVLNSLTDFLKVFMDRGAMPLYVGIPSDDAQIAAQFKKQGAVDAFRHAFSQRYGGMSNSVEPMILAGLKDLKPLGFNMNELAYADLNKLQDSRICTAFGIPPILMGTQVGLEHATYSNYGEARRSFYEDTMTPLWARLDDALTRHLLNDRDFQADLSLQFDTSEIPALQDDVNAAASRAVTAFTAGLISRTNAQRIMGVDPHGDDVFLLPFSASVVPVDGPKPLPKPTAQISDGVDDEQDDDERAAFTRNMLGVLAESRLMTAEDREYIKKHYHDEQEAIAERAALMLASGLGSAITRYEEQGQEPYIKRDGRTYVNERALTPEQRTSANRIAARNKEQIIRLAALAEPILERFFHEQAERIVDMALRSDGTVFENRGGRFGIDETRAIENINWLTEDEFLREAFEQWWATVSETAFTDISEVLGTSISWSVTNPHLVDLFEILGYRVTGINNTTRQAIETVVRESLIEGTTIPEMKQSLKDVVEATYKGRHESIARTESQVAYNTSSQRAYQASGQVSTVRMHDGVDCESKAGSDGLTCPQRNGLVVQVANMGMHIEAEHPRGTLGFSPILDTALGEV